MKRPASYTAAIISSDDPAEPSGNGHGNGATRIRLPKQRRATNHQVQRTSVTLELNSDLVPLIRMLAAALHISPAGIVDRLMHEGLTQYLDDPDRVDFAEHLKPSRSPAYQWVVDIDFEPLRQTLVEALDSLGEVSL